MWASPESKVLLCWSTGKDSAWALHVLRQRKIHVGALLTTFNASTDCVAMHGVSAELAFEQSARVGLPLWRVDLPWPCSNAEYETRMRVAVDRALAEDFTHCAFGDLFLDDIRAYRERQLTGTGLMPLFPLWDEPTGRLAREMIAGGLEASLVYVDTEKLAAAFLHRTFDEKLLADLPPSVDPCGENGEFHTFVWDSPDFSSPIARRPACA